MKFLKQIFGLNSRLKRKGYLLLGVLPMLGMIFLVNNFHFFVTNIVALILFISIFILALISAVKRGRDSGLNGLVTLFLFGAVPVLIIFLNLQLKIDISYMAFAFIAYLLLMPSSSKELKIVGKVEYLLTFIAIILVFPLLIFSLVVPQVPCGGDTVKVDLVCVNMKSNAHALEMFKLDNGIYPTTEEGNAALISSPNPLKYPNYSSDGYLKRLPKDSWAGKLIYVKTKDGFELISYGADRKEGGEDEYADIYYSECK
jgi:general secretion pathway protein G